MKFRSILAAGFSVLMLTACDAILEDENAGPPPPAGPAPPPLDDAPLPIVTATPSEAPSPDVTAPPMAVPTDAAPATDATPLPETTPTSAAGLDATPIFDPTKLTPAEKLAELALINAAPCSEVLNDNSATIAQVAEARDPAPSGNLVTTQVVGGAGSAVALTVLRADFPGIAKLEPWRYTDDGLKASGHCGATRISNNWFVTAAHCLDENYEETVLKVGFEILDKPITREVKSDGTICHAAYNGSDDNYLNDVALIHVSDDAATGLSDVPTAALVSLDAVMTPLNTPTGRIAGWGMTSPGGALSNTLLGTEVAMESIGPALIRVKSVNGRGPCIGDSGGPLFVDDGNGTPVLTGVLSGVEQSSGQRACDGDYTARYTNLQAFRGWMNQVISTCDASSGLCQQD